MEGNLAILQQFGEVHFFQLENDVRRVQVPGLGIALDVQMLVLPRALFLTNLEAEMVRLAVQASQAWTANTRTPGPKDGNFGTQFRYSKKTAAIVEAERCTICLEGWKPNEKLWQTHGANCVYHARCLRKWWTDSTTCPNCGVDCVGAVAR